jgi:hypothetical protein
MTLRVVGVGVGRTGTNSLKIAFERLLDAPCHHMLEILGHPEQVPLWIAAVQGSPDWPAIHEGYAATVDWPGAAFWRDLVVEYPDAIVVLSSRRTPEEWWTSAHNTIFNTLDGTMAMPPHLQEWFGTFGAHISEAGFDMANKDACIAAYERQLADVRATVPAERLVEWTPGDGWGPLCDALGVAVPDEPFPHVNTTDEFRAMVGLSS